MLEKKLMKMESSDQAQTDTLNVMNICNGCWLRR